MIAVIADDLTGAAELGGIGLRYGLTVEISTRVGLSTAAELLVIAADTRSMQEEEAVAEMERITRKLSLLQPEWIYKKTDSVLRGHVVPELKAQLKVLGLERAVLIPANPALGRTILNGHYFLNGLPVNQTAFSEDPEFAVTSSDLQDMLHSREAPVQIRKVGEALPERGIVVGEAQQNGDLEGWAALTGKRTLAAGASGFFSAILGRMKFPVTEVVRPAKPGAHPYGCPALFVSGSTFDRSRETIRKIKAAGGPVSYMPAVTGSLEGEEEGPYREWCEEILTFLAGKGKAIIAIEEGAAIVLEGDVPGDPTRSARLLRTHMAKLVRRVLQEASIKELVIEGGATAYAILELAGLRTFFPVEELAQGVVRMQAGEAPSLFVTVKPGSYDWPESIRQLLEE